jgi:hypothetical protein
MEVFLEFLKEMIKAVIREITAHLFKKKFLDDQQRKTTLSSRRPKQKKKGGFRKYKR